MKRRAHRRKKSSIRRRVKRNPEPVNFRKYSRTATLNPARKKGKKQKFSLAQMRAGIRVEMEHTKRLPKSRRYAAAKRIATDHLRELPDYYTRHRKCFPEEYRKKRNPKMPSVYPQIEVNGRIFTSHQDAYDFALDRANATGEEIVVMQKDDSHLPWFMLTKIRPGGQRIISRRNPMCACGRNPCRCSSNPRKQDKVRYGGKFYTLRQLARELKSLPMAKDVFYNQIRQHRKMNPAKVTLIGPRGMKSFGINRGTRKNPSGGTLRSDSRGIQYVPEHPSWEHAQWLRKIAQRLRTQMRITGENRDQAILSARKDYHFEHPDESLERIKAMLPHEVARNPSKGKEVKKTYMSKGYAHKVFIPNYKRVIDPRSIRTRVIRTKKGGKRLIRFGCPKGQWMPKVKRCKVGTKAISIMTPREEKILALPRGGAIFKVGNPRGFPMVGRTGMAFKIGRNPRRRFRNDDERVMDYRPGMRIRNLQMLPRGLGAKYLIVIPAPASDPGAWVAKAWAREKPTLTGIEHLLVMKRA